jgi:hypothetical protein
VGASDSIPQTASTCSHRLTSSIPSTVVVPASRNLPQLTPPANGRYVIFGGHEVCDTDLKAASITDAGKIHHHLTLPPFDNRPCFCMTEFRSQGLLRVPWLTTTCARASLAVAAKAMAPTLAAPSKCCGMGRARAS